MPNVFPCFHFHGGFALSEILFRKVCNSRPITIIYYFVSLSIIKKHLGYPARRSYTQAYIVRPYISVYVSLPSMRSDFISEIRDTLMVFLGTSSFTGSRV